MTDITSSHKIALIPESWLDSIYEISQSGKCENYALTCIQGVKSATL